MSTRSIQDALDLLESLLDEVDGDDGERAKLDGARVELEAIRKAARAFEEAGIREAWHGDAWLARGEELARLEAAADVLKAIAKES
jgi:hypothetical protein